MIRVIKTITLIVVGGALCLALSIQHFPLSEEIVDIANGEEIFRSKCASCHSLSSIGPNGLGPSLDNIGKLAESRADGLDAPEYLIESILRPDSYRAPGSEGQMPTNIGDSLTRTELANVVAFLCAQGGQLDYRRVHELAQTIPDKNVQGKTRIDLASAERGRHLFMGKQKCHECHKLDQALGSFLGGPSLLTIGAHSPDYLRKSIQNPSAAIVDSYETVTLVGNDGLPIKGQIVSQDDRTISLVVRSDNGFAIQDIAIDDLETEGNGQIYVTSPTSPMPSYQTMPDDEMRDLVEFLRTLR